MRKNYLPKILFLTFCISSSAIASYSNTGKIEWLLPTPAGNVFFKAGVQVSPPACSPSNEYAFQLTGADANGGKAMLASLLAAQAAGKNVFVSGRGVCDISGGRETVDYIVVYTN